jgi:hypothetical protein
MVILHSKGLSARFKAHGVINHNTGEYSRNLTLSSVPFQQVVMAALETPPERKPKTKVKGGTG